jgi:polynucleotide 5'-triphosphatase
MNGKQASFTPQTAPPPFVKAETNGHHVLLPASQQDDPTRLLGPWEKSITGKKPFEQITKIVADWLFLNVVSRGDDGELASRGVEIEIEAKLGQLIDRETHERYFVPVQSECVLRDNPRVTFKSSMTEV